VTDLLGEAAEAALGVDPWRRGGRLVAAGGLVARVRGAELALGQLVTCAPGAPRCAAR